jgi:hypothetical protein
MKQTALRHEGKNKLAVVTPATVYFSNMSGVIYHHFPNARFNTAPYSEIVEFPGDFEAAKAAYFEERAAKKAAKEAAIKAAAEAEYKARRDAVLNLWKWRHGELECYAVDHYKWVTDDSLHYGAEDEEHALFFSLEEATKYADKVAEENKDFAEPGYRFNVAITHVQKCELGQPVDIPVAERLSITTTEGIYEEYMQHSHLGGVRHATFEQEIAEGCVVATYEGKEGGLVSVRWPSYHECTGDLAPDMDSRFCRFDKVINLSELDYSNDYHLIKAIRELLPLAKEEAQKYFDQEMVEVMFDDDDDDDDDENDDENDEN